MNKLSRRDFLRMAGSLAAGTVLAACQPKATVEQPAEKVAKETPTVAKQAPPPTKEPITIVYWHGWGGRFGEWVDRIAAQFHEDNPDIVVEPLIVSWDELYPKLLTAVAAGTPPDTMVAGNETGQLYSLAAQQVIVPIEDIADPDDFKNLMDALHPGIRAISTYEGKVWAVPKWTQAYALYVNTEHLAEEGIDPEKPPQSYAELDQIAEALYRRESDGTITRIGFDPGSWYFNWWGRYNGKYLDEDGQPSATHENNLKCLKWMISYSEKYDPTKVAEFQTAVAGGDTTDPFITGNFSIYRSGPWHEGTIKEFAPDFPLVVWPFPVPEWAEEKGMSTGGDIPVIPRGVKNPQASFKWVRYMTGVDSPETYATLWTVGLRPHMPISEQVARGPAFDKVYEMFPGFKVFADDFFSSVWYPPAKTPIAEFYADRLSSWFETARLLEVSPEEALQNAEKEARDELAKWQAAH